MAMNATRRPRCLSDGTQHTTPRTSPTRTTNATQPLNAVPRHRTALRWWEVPSWYDLTSHVYCRPCTSLPCRKSYSMELACIRNMQHMGSNLKFELFTESLELLIPESFSPPCVARVAARTTFHKIAMPSDFTPKDAMRNIPKWVNKIQEAINATPEVAARRSWKNILEECSVPPMLTVALLGGTGAGKSSLLNAILEGDIVPTSGNKACTSVVTEIKYHDAPGHKADVHFISKEDWEHDLGIFVADILDDFKENHRKDKASDEAKKSWDALAAVYTNLTWKELVESPSQEFLKDTQKWPSLKYLGTMTHITCDNLPSFSKELRKWTGGKSPWPLVRKVSVHCASELLASGLTLVDLPGLGDSNAARCAVTEDFIKNSDHFFIVLRVGRAADDIWTSDLLGISKLQLKLGMDGVLQASKVTFIVTMCDTLSYEEMINSLEDDDEPQLAELQHHLQLAREHARGAEAGEATAFARRKDFEDEASNNGMGTSTKTEPREESDASQLKRPSPDQNVATQSKRTRLDIIHYRESKASSSVREYSVFHDLSHARATLSNSRKELKKADYALRAYCSQRQSQETSDTLLRKITDTVAQNGGERSANEFSVFTVSTWDYQKLAGRMSGEPSCFLNAADTHIPSLRSHCRRLGDHGQQEYAQMALLKMKKLLQSILRSLQDDRKNATDRRVLALKWAKGEQSLESRLKQTYAKQQVLTERNLKTNLKNGLSEVCSSGAKRAAEDAPDTIENLLKNKKTLQFQAIMRRQGTAPAWKVDLNDELASLFLRTILDSWRSSLEDDFFSTVRTEIQDSSRKLLDEVVASCQSTALKQYAQSLAEVAISEVAVSMSALHQRAKKQLDSEQKTLSREITVLLQARLFAGYSQALAISGNGSAQKEYLTKYVRRERREIFDGLDTFVLQRFDRIALSIGKLLGKGLNQVAEAIHDEMGPLWEQRPEETRDSEEVRSMVQGMYEELGKLTDQASKWKLD
ncbi:Nuclear GTPase SLIP-GC [Hypsizygus marmoreus]|uniref:Nuclear GTPase SLIP-GC n=1 Tax=Hypsizygus marmoreus TaxID=39966 RepID=A0A369JWV6_HYPMA|nr:Nuclear GTPase SLIP-GC [Hypsizygus marmoreus]